MAAEGRVVGKTFGGGISGSSQPAEVGLDIPDVSSSFSRSIKEWLGSIMNDAGESGKNQSQRPKIQKVPRMLRKIESNKECYDPLVVSIGPYHHGNLELESMEKLKITMARQYVKGCERPIDDLYKKVEEVAGDARNCYAEGSTGDFNDEVFTQMMFLDGCFILQFIYCIVNNKREAIKMKNHDIAFVQRDLFLLENQLPFRVLKELVSFRRFEKDDGLVMINNFIKLTRALPPDQGDSCKKRIEKFIRKCIGATQNPSELKKIEFDQPVHLLELLRTQRINVDASKCGCHLSNPSSDWFSYRSAKELKAVGIHFRPCKTRYFTDVEYKSTLLFGMLTLPPITVDDLTKSMLLNLVAYETCPDAPNDYGVTSYICFLDSLIDQAEDVKELRSKGILLNLLGGDQQVADLVNEIAIGLVPNPDAYVEVKWQIERHYKNKIKLWITEWLHTHFSSPWTILAFVGAIFALSLSVTQTYYARFPQEK